MSKKNGNRAIYKDGRVYLDGKLIGIGFEDGRPVPRASDYRLPKRLSTMDKRLIETTQAVLEGFKAARENAAKAKK